MAIYMKKNKNLKHSNEIIRIIYPKQYTSYVILSLLIIAFCTYLGYLSGNGNLTDNLSISEVFYSIVIYLSLILISLYFITTIIFLFLKRIKLEVKEKEIQINKVFIKRKILITDIDSIRIGRVSLEYLLSYVIIKRRKYGNKYSSKYLIFPVSWFSLSHLRYVLEFAKERNKKIEFTGILRSQYNLQSLYVEI